jgi:SAM-dependent methyltransferase
MDFVLDLATSLMRWGSKNRKFGHRECYTESFVKPAQDQISVATLREFEDGQSFFIPFQGLIAPTDLSGQDVLDLGCGHGGRTAYYLVNGNPRSIVGLEISRQRVAVAAESVRRMTGDARVSFAVGLGEGLPFAENTFDIIISYDVFEHVRDLPLVVAECHRVLRRGGQLCALFPPYYGPRAHHLDFVTTLPFLHHVFSPRVLVSAANRILQEQPQLRDQPLPAPHQSYNGKVVLPRLNGTTERAFGRIISGSRFKRAYVSLLPFGWGPGGIGKRLVRGACRTMLAAPWPFTRDIFAGTIRCVLEK